MNDMPDIHSPKIQKADQKMLCQKLGEELLVNYDYNVYTVLLYQTANLSRLHEKILNNFLYLFLI